MNNLLISLTVQQPHEFIDNEYWDWEDIKFLKYHFEPEYPINGKFKNLKY